jgi:chaperonin cofactor prefoldin
LKLDLKTAIMIGTLLFTVSGFYYTTISDLNSLTLKIEALESENRIQQKRLDLLDKKITRMNKKLKGI